MAKNKKETEPPKKASEPTKGIVLLAIGNPVYGKMAVNMAVSLKFHNPDIKIQVICEEFTMSHLGAWHRSFFDINTIIDTKDCRHEKGGLFPALAKLNLYKYAAFDENIYLDVDAVCTKSIDKVWEACQGGWYLSQLTGVHKITDAKNDFTGLQWAKVNDIVKYYGLETGDVIPAINSSFQYFTKSDKTKELFDLALELLSNPIPTGLHPMQWTKKDEQPDELYMDVALAKKKHVPELSLGHVIYFDNQTLKQDRMNSCFFVGLYGGVTYTHSSLQDYADRELHKIYRTFHRKEHLYKVKVLLRGKI